MLVRPALTRRLVGLGLAIGLGLGACTAPRTTGNPSAPEVVVGSLPAGPPPTIDRLPIPEMPIAWEPPVAIASDPAALARALAGASRIHVQLGTRLDGEVWRRGVREALAGWGWQGDVAFLAPAAITSVVADVGAARALAMAGGDPDDVPLAEPWRARNKPGAAPGTLVVAIDDAPLDEATWRARPAVALGSCDAPLEALAVGQEQSLGDLEPFLDHADRVLGKVFRAELAAALPDVLDALAPHAKPRPRTSFADVASWEAHECGHAAWQYTQVFARCLAATSACEVAPRVVLVGGLRVVAPTPQAFLPRSCPAILDLDVAARLDEAADRAAVAAVVRFDAQWSALADRLGALTEVHAALEDVCAPRRRRFAAADVEQARRRVVALGRSLASSDPPRSGRWIHEPVQVHVPGTGPVREVARFDAGPGSPVRAVVEGARSLREFVLSRAVCRASATSLPLMVVVTEPATDRVLHVGFHYEEALACGALGPLGGSSPPAPDGGASSAGLRPRQATSLAHANPSTAAYVSIAKNKNNGSYDARWRVPPK
jgi:hypothetical protein